MSKPMSTHKTFVVTGGAGFIGSAVVRRLLEAPENRVVTLDALTYAGHRETLSAFADHPRHRFVELDIGDRAGVDALFLAEQPDAVLHLAAETHVDRSIDDPEVFVRTNTLGTVRLLEASRAHLARLNDDARAAFRFLMVSTDEVYGSLGAQGKFDENSPYQPRSPYSASKAAADHFARAYFHTFGVPVIVTNCSNNYGPYQYPEKLIPVNLLRALRGQSVAVYGDGSNVRDWLYVDDHAEGLVRVVERGTPGETYLLGGDAERSNLEVMRAMLSILNDMAPASTDSTSATAQRGKDHLDLITFVGDRPGHDFRYAVDGRRIARELGWRPKHDFETGLRATVRWYLDHLDWVHAVTDGRYAMQRLGAP